MLCSIYYVIIIYTISCFIICSFFDNMDQLLPERIIFREYTIRIKSLITKIWTKVDLACARIQFLSFSWKQMRLLKCNLFTITCVPLHQRYTTRRKKRILHLKSLWLCCLVSNIIIAFILPQAQQGILLLFAWWNFIYIRWCPGEAITVFSHIPLWFCF